MPGVRTSPLFKHFRSKRQGQHANPLINGILLQKLFKIKSHLSSISYALVFQPHLINLGRKITPILIYL